jgi:hypothetical protein
MRTCDRRQFFDGGLGADTTFLRLLGFRMHVEPRPDADILVSKERLTATMSFVASYISVPRVCRNTYMLRGFDF